MGVENEKLSGRTLKLRRIGFDLIVLEARKTFFRSLQRNGIQKKFSGENGMAVMTGLQGFLAVTKNFQ